MTAGTAVLTAGAGFLVGAVPFSYFLARCFGGIDIRTVGSGNVGATNVARSLGFRVGSAALILDAAKGVAAVLLARAIAGGEAVDLQALAGGMAIVGHNFSPFLGFRGGKGVATGTGVFALLAPWALLAALGVFLTTVVLTHFVSLGSVLAAATLPVAVYFLEGKTGVLYLALGVAILVTIRHRGNLSRIMGGTEDRIGEREEP